MASYFCSSSYNGLVSVSYESPFFRSFKAPFSGHSRVHAHYMNTTFCRQLTRPVPRTCRGALWLPL